MKKDEVKELHKKYESKNLLTSVYQALSFNETMQSSNPEMVSTWGAPVYKMASQERPQAAWVEGDSILP